MKLDMEVKPEDSETYQGEYSNDDLECQLQHFIAAKKIESDPTMMAKLKEYALAKNKMIAGFFDDNRPAKKAPESFADLKKIKKEKDEEESEEMT